MENALKKLGLGNNCKCGWSVPDNERQDDVDRLRSILIHVKTFHYDSFNGPNKRALRTLFKAANV